MKFYLVVQILSLLFVFFIFAFVVSTDNSIHKFSVTNNSNVIINHIIENKNNDKHGETHKEVTYTDTYLNVSNFNYTGKCSEVFKYKKNNPRDLFLTAIYFKNPNVWFTIKDRAVRCLKVAQSGIPKATRKVLLLSDDEIPDFTKTMNELGVSVENHPINTTFTNGAVLRYFAAYDYLTQNQEKYDRVVFGDFKDIYFFADGFATFDVNDLIFLMECKAVDNTKTCVTLAEPTNRRWIQTSFGKAIADGYANNRTFLSNVGVVLGGTAKLLKYIEIFKDNVIPEKADNWGHDQALHNKLLYSGYFESLNYTKDYCTQRVCFSEDKSVVWDAKNKALYTRGTGCAPVIRHKIWFNNRRIYYE
ncbi:hypothetical protein EIN_116480 [Entamoeba invadens IP1]|uniref:Nucleotide-diphospho-sugar transferase domain-containing protein n=1 Tax=Entamoeba invadens IP1 TaxID=370355 RepID=L7FNG4_ENTIV|nr:hypothetical protein EIN_116480 [Entamoeba invadens IP1]ELP94537.1 hypothetical protein EIN_116480 [Entamoeba invadens IP1]|eukprot:XP_004261308.1 hypothetical protein EIN_116480 [Entamoeba invadens IP1]